MEKLSQLWEKLSRRMPKTAKAIEKTWPWALIIVGIYMLLSLEGCSTAHFMQSTIVKDQDTVGFMFIERGNITKNK